jgi:hypothetical protein
VLLVATALGLASMHTLGHGIAHAGSPVSHGSAITDSQMRPSGDDPCDADRCVHILAQSHRPGGHELPAWSVCVAVLVGLAAAVLLAALADDRGRPCTTHIGANPPERVDPRAPTDRPIGLTLADLSVLRT